jgi:hypothetical protein
MHQIENYLTKLEKNITMPEINKLNDIITQNECVLKSELSIRFENITGII